jgi:hypothetical protein
MEKTMADNKTQVAKVPDDPNTLPDYLRNQKHVPNQDNFDSSDVTLPRIKLVQALSKEMENYPGIARVGSFWHTGLDIDLGPKVRFIVCDRRKKYLLQAPISDGQGILARADDAVTWDREGKWTVKIKNVKEPQVWQITDRNVINSGLAEWGTSVNGDDDSPPAATLFYDYLVMLPDMLEVGPAIVSLARSQIRAAKKGLNDKISLHGTNGRPMQALMFEANGVDDSSDGQDYKNWMFKSAGFVQDPELFEAAKSLRGALANIIIDGESTVVDDEIGPGDTGAGKF